MNPVVFKLLFAALVIAMNFIRVYFFKRYKITHSANARVMHANRERRLVSIVRLALLVPGLLWLFSPWLSFAQVALPDSIRISAFFIGVYGMWLFYRVHKILGDNWSPVLEVRDEHRLVVEGPYRYVRHPMYTSMILWCVSFTLLTANCLYGIVLISAFAMLFIIRIPDEEKLMDEQFNGQYQHYAKRVKRLIPFIY